jgi:RNA polymerase sigma factor (TIGR02999 family)
MEAGDREAASQIIARTHAELRAIGASFLKRQQKGGSLQLTALVNEAFVKLLGGERKPGAVSEREFLFLAARAMRQIVIDHHRARSLKKRRPPGDRVPLDDLVDHFEQRSHDLEALGEALERLERLDPLAGRLVNLKFFAGLSTKEAARVLGLSERSAEREWQAARAWLRREIQ